MIEDQPKTSTLPYPEAIDRDYIVRARQLVTDPELQQKFDNALVEMEKLAARYADIPVATKGNFGSQMEARVVPLKMALSQSNVENARDVASAIVAMYENAAGHDRSQFATYGKR